MVKLWIDCYDVLFVFGFFYSISSLRNVVLRSTSTQNNDVIEIR